MWIGRRCDTSSSTLLARLRMNQRALGISRRSSSAQHGQRATTSASHIGTVMLVDTSRDPPVARDCTRVRARTPGGADQRRVSAPRPGCPRAASAAHRARRPCGSTGSAPGSSCSSPGGSPRPCRTGRHVTISVTIGSLNGLFFFSASSEACAILQLGGVVGEDRGAVRRSVVAELRVLRGRIDRAPEVLDQLLVADLARVVHDLHRLGVAGDLGSPPARRSGWPSCRRCSPRWSTARRAPCRNRPPRTRSSRRRRWPWRLAAGAALCAAATAAASANAAAAANDAMRFMRPPTRTSAPRRCCNNACRWAAGRR